MLGGTVDSVYCTVVTAHTGNMVGLALNQKAWSVVCIYPSVQACFGKIFRWPPLPVLTVYDYTPLLVYGMPYWRVCFTLSSGSLYPRGILASCL